MKRTLFGLALAGLLLSPVMAMADGPSVIGTHSRYESRGHGYGDHRGSHRGPDRQWSRPPAYGHHQGPGYGHFYGPRRPAWVQPHWTWNGWRWVWAPGYWGR